MGYQFRCRDSESSVDDLGTWRGVVLGRAVTTLRSVETQPLAWGFVLSVRRDPSDFQWFLSMMFISIIQLIIEFKRFFFVTLRGHSPRHERIQKYYFVGAICDIFSIRISFFYLYLQTGIRRDMSYNDFARSDSGQRRGNTTTSLKQHSMFSFICIPDGAFAVKY